MMKAGSKARSTGVGRTLAITGLCALLALQSAYLRRVGSWAGGGSAVRYHQHVQQLPLEPLAASATRNVVLVKTFKTGSTTLGSLLFRFGLRHGLKFYALPNEDDHYVSPLLPPCNDCNISFYHARGSRMLAEQDYRRLVPNASFITIVREPISRHLSDFYYHFAPSRTNGSTADAVHALIDQEERLFDMALALDVNASGSGDAAAAAAAEDKRRVAQRLDMFQAVLVLERFDESLVMMKRKFQWAMEDLLYLPVNEGCGNVRPWDGKEIKCPLRREDLSAGQVERLNCLLAIDRLIYDEANRRLDAYVAKVGKDAFAEEVDSLRQVLQRFEEICEDDVLHRHRDHSCDIYRVGDFPGGYEKLARDCTLKKHIAHGLPQFACLASRNAVLNAAARVLHGA
jgi:Galactose-3-O-sulfotransferase